MKFFSKFSRSDFDLSFKRIVSRVLLAGAIGILFGILMFPFMTLAEGLYQQKAAVGGQNIKKMVALWGLFTLTFSLFAFWRKKWRMVSVFLIGCWILSLTMVGLLFLGDGLRKDCKRAVGYEMNSEFERALDLIAQRMGVDDDNDSYWRTAYNYRNCLNIDYSSENVEFGTEGFFLAEDPSMQDLKIKVHPDYKSYDDLSIATLLSHELAHVAQYVNEEIYDKEVGCYESEAEAFLSQALFLNQLNEEERRSIYSRLREDIDANPAFSIVLNIGELQGEVNSACVDLKKRNDLTQKQFNQCFWTGLQNKLLNEVKLDPFYQDQCE